MLLKQYVTKWNWLEEQKLKKKKYLNGKRLYTGTAEFRNCPNDFTQKSFKA